VATDKIIIEIDVEGNAAKQIKKLDKTTDNFVKDTKKGFASLGRIFDNFVANIGSAAVVGAFNVASRAARKLFDVFIVDGIRAAQAQEDAVNKLNTALQLSGKFSAEASQSLQDFASELQSVTTFGDEAILETQALIQSLGQLEEEGLKRATAATLDLSAALGIDLKAAALLVGKAASGEISSFSRYGLIIQKGATNAETFEKALTALETKFGGAAQAQVQTFSGSMAQLSNTFGDLTEATGESIVKNDTAIQTIQGLTDIFAELEMIVDDNQEAIQEFISKSIIVGIRATADLVRSIETLNATFNNLSRTVKAATLDAINPAAVSQNVFNLARK